MKFMASPRFLTMYSGVLTAIFAMTILGSGTRGGDAPQPSSG